jgi:penicillin amidase
MSLLLLLSGCAVTSLMTQGRSLPTVEGALSAPGLGGEVTILRDAKGIPHIRANSEADLSYSVGFVHAQDRQWQMDMVRRMAYGRMAEILGPDFAEFDAFMQGLQLQERAKASLKNMAPDTRFQLAAYAQGVNAGAETSKAPPIEYRLLDSNPIWAPWTPVDSMAMTFLQSLILSSGQWQELAAFELRDKLDRDDVDALFRLLETTPRTDPYWEQLREAETGAYTSEFQGFMDMMGPKGADGEASNVWVVGPQRSKGDAPILANDPHLPVRVPNAWYVYEGQGGDLHVAGASMPGLPWVVSGHNGSMAWGVTNLMGDYVDYVVLERDGDTGYILAGERKTLQVREQTVALPEGLSQSHKTQWTEVGPVVTELSGTHILALRWTALEQPDGSPDLLRAISLAPDIETLFALDLEQPITALNIVFGDSAGNIAYRAVGQLPTREAHTGRVPYPGSSEYHGWSGLVEKHPQVVNPTSGMLVSANARPPELEDADAPETLGTAFMQPWREDRIKDLLLATNKHSLATIADVQMDTLDTHSQATMGPLLEGLEPKSVGAQWVLEALTGWDFQTPERSIAPLVYAELQKQLVILALEEKGLNPAQIDRVLRLSSPGRSLLDTPSGLTHWVPDTDSTTRTAMLRAHDNLKLVYGEDSTTWSWGAAHKVRFAHPFGVKVLDAGELDRGGSGNTVNVGAFNWARSYETTWIPSIRVITPLNDPSQATVVMPPGQSGHPGSRNYQDQIRSWKTGGSIPLWYTDADVERATAFTLVLQP